MKLLAHRHVDRADAAADRSGQGTLDGDEAVAAGVERRLGEPLAGLIVRLAAGKHLAPGNGAAAAVGLRDRGVEDDVRRAGDVGADAVALDEWDFGIRGHVETPALHGDSFAHGA